MIELLIFFGLGFLLGVVICIAIFRGALLLILKELDERYPTPGTDVPVIEDHFSDG